MAAGDDLECGTQAKTPWTKLPEEFFSIISTVRNFTETVPQPLHAACAVLPLAPHSTSSPSPPPTLPHVSSL